MDAYSKYPEVISVPNTSRQTVAIIRKLCAQHGVPETIVSDNGTQFTSHEFWEFSKANAVSHILSSTYHPQSNGRAERFVDTFKRGLLKLRGEGDVDTYSWLTERHPVPLFHNNVVRLNCSSEVSPGQHWISYS
jgi:transposase InsO family protein